MCATGNMDLESSQPARFGGAVVTISGSHAQSPRASTAVEGIPVPRTCLLSTKLVAG